MSLTLLALCNQKLSFAKQLVSMLPSDDQSVKGAGALLEGAIHHLSLSMRFYLCEVGSWYGIKQKTLFQDVDDLIVHLPSDMHDTPIIDQLRALQLSTFSWLTIINSAQRELMSLSNEKKAPALDQLDGNLIAVKNLEINNWQNRTTLEQLINEMEMFFAQQRLLMKEF